MKAVGEQFVFKVNLRCVRVGEGVDGHVQVKGNFGDGARNREEPFQHAGVLGGTGRVKPLRLRMLFGLYCRFTCNEPLLQLAKLLVDVPLGSNCFLHSLALLTLLPKTCFAGARER